MGDKLIKLGEPGGICRSGRLQRETLSPGVDDGFGGMKRQSMTGGMCLGKKLISRREA